MNEFEELLNSVSEVNTGDVITAEVISVDNDKQMLLSKELVSKVF